MTVKNKCQILFLCYLCSFFGQVYSSQEFKKTNKCAAELFSLHQLAVIGGDLPVIGQFGFKNARIALTNELNDGLPAKFSWLDRGIMTSIKDQQIEKCGSCWAFAAVGTVEALIKRSDGIEVDLSEQQIVNCVIEEGSGCEGGNGFLAHWYMVNHGIVREHVYPYLAEDWACDVSEPSEYYLENAWQYLDDGSETKLARRQKLKHLIMTYGPLDAVMAVYEDFLYYTTGIYIPDVSTGFRTYHGIVIVGWEDDPMIPGGGFWIVKNCWGEEWGEYGYFRMSFDTEGFNGIEFDIKYSVYNGLGNDPPYFEELGSQYDIFAGDQLVIDCNTVDPDGDELRYGLENPPQGMRIDSSTGVITWVPDNSQAGEHWVVITVSDEDYSIGSEIMVKVKKYKKIGY